MGRRISDINNIDTADMTKKLEECDNIEDEEQSLIEMMALGFRTLSEVRNLCLRSNQNFRIVEQLQEKAERVYCEADRHRQLYHLRKRRFDLFQETIHRERGCRYEDAAETHLRSAFKELKTAYWIVNKNGERELHTGSDPTPLENYDRAFGFLQERYDRSMAHVGAGRLPSFRGYMNGEEANLFLGKIISDRQLKLMTTVLTEIKEDLKNSRMNSTKLLYLRHAIPLTVSLRTFHRGDVIVIQ